MLLCNVGRKEDRMSNVPIQIRLPDKDCALLDQYRRSQANPPTRPEAIRELLRKALTLRTTAAVKRFMAEQLDHIAPNLQMLDTA